ncbi:hypothetical protein TNCV_1740941 [Trichonephila clavipes]|uniref:Uncharacterized protein n=1 Tax=Trichonephila clavipes TaxID=2585209 RepID=A0A8X6V3U8_TRICX|nr:hypothetical protein TNCV_1740941 [Trichonephila clavipes]
MATGSYLTPNYSRSQILKSKKQRAFGSPGHCGFYQDAPGESRSGFPLLHNHQIWRFGCNLHWLGLVTKEACPLCGSAIMDDDHVLQCPRLNEHLVSRSHKSLLGGSASNGQEAKHGSWINK